MKHISFFLDFGFRFCLFTTYSTINGTWKWLKRIASGIMFCQGFIFQVLKIKDDDFTSSAVLCVFLNNEFELCNYRRQNIPNSGK